MGYVIQWIDSNLVMALSIFSLVFVPAWLMKCQQGLRINWKIAFLLGILQALIGVNTFKIFAIIEAWDINTPINYRLYGPIFMMPLLYWLWAKYTKRDVAYVFDAFAVAININLLIARLQCLARGCCGGVCIVKSSDIRWPLVELEVLFYIIFIAIYYNKVSKRKTFGEVYPIYLIAYGTFRFAIEWFREEYTTKIGIFHIAHIWSIIAIVAGAAFYYRLLKNKKNSPKGKKRQTDRKIISREGGAK